MALKVLMLKRERDGLNKQLTELREQADGFDAREGELAEAINELADDATEEEKAAVEEAVAAFEEEKTETNEKIQSLEDRVSKIEEEIAAEEAAQGGDPEPEPAADPDEGQRNTGGKIEMVRAKNFRNMADADVRTLMEREDVKSFLSEIRTAIKEKRAITGAGLLAPEVFIGIIRENLQNYSKLYKHVQVRQISGDGRQVVMGAIPEAVWTDCCGILNELDLVLSDVEVACWKVGGIFDICNANLEDSDVNLADELLTALGQAIGLALDKAIVFGLGTRMPKGIFTRLAETEAPADYPATARPWADLHSTNIITTNKEGIELFAEILTGSAAAKGRYSRGEKVWVMNETTYTYLKAQGLAVNAAGAIVSAVDGAMPVVGGIVEVLDFMPDYVVVGGYMDLYLLAERSGIRLDQSEHAMFIQDRTVFRGTARYDGVPSIAEGFVAIGVNGTTPSASDISFAPDTANAESN